MRDIYDVTEDLLKVYERIRDMFRHWTGEYHEAFICEMLKLNPLEQELQEITGNWDDAHRINVGIYRSIFPNARKYERTEPR